MRDRIVAILQGLRSEKPDAEEAAAERGQLQSQETVSRPAPDPALLVLPDDHPLQQLFHIRWDEAGSMPNPWLSMDRDETLPPEVIQRERERLQGGLRSASAARLKSVQGRIQEAARAGEDGAEGRPEPPGLDASPWIFLSSDRLYAWMLVFPPAGPGQELSREILDQALQEQKISYGVNETLLDGLAQKENRYFYLFLIARGKPAVDGEDGRIQDCVPRVIERVLQVDEYDQADYTSLDLFHSVEKGQEICRLIHPTRGEPGRTVQDQEIPAKDGRPATLPKGRNTELSEDGESLVATVPGHVEFTGRSFQVKSVLDVPGNVDFSTGNIKFLGDVNIKGDVLSGFTVQSMGSIQVGGAIEAGSTVEAGGDLTVVKGILGDGTTIVRSQRCVFAKYIENATIYVKGNLQADAIINSSIYCDGEVVVRSGRGTIMGGQIWAAKRVSALSVGSISERRTAVSLGGLPCTNFERELVKKELEALEVELERLECQLDSPAKAGLIGKTRIKLRTTELRLHQLDAELENVVKEPQDQVDTGRLECATAHAGTEISFGSQVLRLQQEKRNCVAKLSGGEIVVM